MRHALLPSLLWSLVALQVAIPASYYLVREDREDERFAWRMFSAVRLKRCEVAAFEQGARTAKQRIDLSVALHASWIRSLERGRARVIEGFLRQRCRASGGAKVSMLERRCTAPSGAVLPEELYRYDCSLGSLERH